MHSTLFRTIARWFRLAPLPTVVSLFTASSTQAPWRVGEA